jgi:large subunit ribosomal protein L7/L12
MVKNNALLQLRVEKHKLTVSLGGLVSLTVPLETAASQTPSAPRARKGNGQFAPLSAPLDSEAPVATVSLPSAAPVATVSLVSRGSSRIEAVKAVRDICGLGLKEAIGLVDDAPSVIKEDIPLPEAEAIKAALENVGATAAVRLQHPRGNGQGAFQHVGAG